MCVVCLSFKDTEPSPLQDSFSVRQQGGLPGPPPRSPSPRIHRRPGVLPWTVQHYCPVVSGPNCFQALGSSSGLLQGPLLWIGGPLGQPRLNVTHQVPSSFEAPAVPRPQTPLMGSLSSNPNRIGTSEGHHSTSDRFLAIYNHSKQLRAAPRGDVRRWARAAFANMMKET